MIMTGAIIGIGYGSVTPIFQTQTINSESHIALYFVGVLA